MRADPALPQGEEKVRAVRTMFDAIAPRYDLVNRLMTFRLDVRWRRLAVESLGLAHGALVADLASGTGDLCVVLAKAGHRPLSFDLSLGMLTADRSGAARVQADILRLPLAAGVYQYSFRAASGEWFVPASTPGRRDDGMGGHDAVLVVS